MTLRTFGPSETANEPSETESGGRSMRERRPAMELAEDRQFVGGGGSGLGDPGGEADGPAGGVADGLMSDAGMQAGHGHLAALGIGLEDGEVGDEAGRALGGDAQALAVVAALAVAEG